MYNINNATTHCVSTECRLGIQQRQPLGRLMRPKSRNFDLLTVTHQNGFSGTIMIGVLTFTLLDTTTYTEPCSKKQYYWAHLYLVFIQTKENFIDLHYLV